jgi:hypothetical protein
LNLRPSGYEPDELPDCSTPRRTKHCTHVGAHGQVVGYAFGVAISVTSFDTTLPPESVPFGTLYDTPR